MRSRESGVRIGSSWNRVWTEMSRVRLREHVSRCCERFTIEAFYLPTSDP